MDIQGYHIPNHFEYVQRCRIYSPGWVVGVWLDQMEIRLTSASVEVEVELS